VANYESRPCVLVVSPTAEITGPTNSLRLFLDRLGPEFAFEVLVSGEGPFLDQLAERGVPFWTVPTLRRERIPFLAREFRRRSFPLLYANETNGATRNACVAAALAGTPFISHVRNMGWRHGWTQLGHLAAARAVIAVSHACGESVQRFVRADRLHVIHNGVPAREFGPPGADDDLGLREELGVSEDSTLILMLGHLTQRKGQREGIEVIREVLREVQGVHVCVVGAEDRDINYVQKVKQSVRNAGMDGMVSFLGFRKDVGRILRSTDLLLHTASADPHPRAVLEAMAMGLPVVAFATDGVAETVEDGVTGYLVPRGDVTQAANRIARLIKNPDQLAGMGRAGRRAVEERFSDARTAQRVGEVLRRVLPPRRPPQLVSRSALYRGGDG
jgi:glycosyltransferase involved in cell wall biosynthesis